MAEEKKEGKQQSVDIDALVAERLAEKEKEIEERKEKELKEKYEKILEEERKKDTQNIENIILEREKAKAETDKEDKQNDNKNFIESDVAKEILAKRKKQEEDAIKAKEQAIIEKERQELAQLKLEKKLAKMLKDEPWMEEPVLEAMKEGTIKTEEEIKIYFNKVTKEKFKTAWLAEKAYKKAGLDPMAISEGTGIVTDQVAKQKRHEQLVEQWKKKLR